jgi:hypothetical protein
MMRRVAVLRRNGKDIQEVCEDQESAIQWMKENRQAGDEWVCIEDEDLNVLRLRKSFLTATDIILLREMKIGL